MYIYIEFVTLPAVHVINSNGIHGAIPFHRPPTMYVLSCMPFCCLQCLKYTCGVANSIHSYNYVYMYVSKWEKKTIQTAAQCHTGSTSVSGVNLHVNPSLQS